MYKPFLDYMQRHYFVEHWSAAYQPQLYSNTETNNFIESWHDQQLKTTYLGEKRNGRVDTLISVLVHDVEPDYIDNIRRIQLNVGRMGPEERRKKKREPTVEDINAAILETMITEPDANNRNFRISSFSDNHSSYEIEVSDGKIKACSCADFEWNKIACKYTCTCFEDCTRRYLFMNIEKNQRMIPTILILIIIFSTFCGIRGSRFNEPKARG